ncbi:MAG: M48 family metallopeptidase [Myxococcaceae bacterium]
MDHLSQARALLPLTTQLAVVPWGLGFIACIVITGWATSRKPVREAIAAPDEPWHQKAALVHRARIAARVPGLVALLLPIVGGAARYAAEKTLFGRQQFFEWLAFGFLGMILCGLVARPQLRSLRSPGIDAGGVRGALAQFVMMRFTLVPLCGFICAGLLLSGTPWAWLCFAAAAGSVLFASWIGYAILKVSGLAGPADERLRRAVEAAQVRTGVRAREVLSVPFPSANAFALPGVGVIAFTHSTLELFNEAEIEAVAAHELDHVRRSSSFLATRLLLLVAITPLVLLGTGTIPFGLLSSLGALAFVIIALRTSRMIRRRLEVHADHAGEHSREGEETYARALEKLYRANRVPAVIGRRGLTHPELYDRMKAAGVDPGYPRPTPLKPAKPVLIAVGCGVYLAIFAIKAISPMQAESDAELIQQIALSGGTADEVRQLAWFRATANNYPEAVVFAKAVETLEPGNPTNTLAVAKYELALGHCELASEITEHPEIVSAGVGTPSQKKKRWQQIQNLRRDLQDAQCADTPGE